MEKLLWYCMMFRNMQKPKECNVNNVELKHHVKYKKEEKQHITLHHTDWFVGMGYNNYK